MPFPKPPFKLDKGESETDALLVKYLTRTEFPYLSSETKRLIDTLQATALRGQNSALLDLWPRILTDALKCLKQHDPREWDREKTAVNYASFFHEGSLGVDELRTVLESFARFEGMLYGASPDRYRDHIAHAFRVWAIGHAILTEESCFPKGLSSDELPQADISSDEWQCMWAIAALCHDLGYPISHIERINSLARDALQGMGLVHGGDLRFPFSQQMLPFHDSIIKMMASKPVSLAPDPGFSTHLQNKYYLKLLKSFDNLDHGVVSSLLVSKALVYFLESDLARDEHAILSEEDARQFLVRREILRAIAAHTCQDIYHLRFDSLAFLLYIVDEIQSWGRPTLEELQHQAVGIGAGDAEIRAFRPDKIAVVIWTGESKWSARQREAAIEQLNKLRRMLRLGVGTAALKDRYLEFAVVPKSEEGVHLLLKSGEIKWSEVTASKLDSASLAVNR